MFDRRQPLQLFGLIILTALAFFIVVANSRSEPASAQAPVYAAADTRNDNPTGGDTPTPTGTPTLAPTLTRTPTNTAGPSATPISNNRYCNLATVTIPQAGAATPYPAIIKISDLSGFITGVTIDLNDLRHEWMDDIDMLLVGPQSQNVLFLSDAGDNCSHIPTLFRFADGAPLFPNLRCAGGNDYIFGPTNYTSSEGDNFPAPAPAPPYGSTLSVFNGTSPNGNWKLYAFDDYGIFSGRLNGGWCLTIAVDESVTQTPTATPTATLTPIPTPSATVGPTLDLQPEMTYTHEPPSCGQPTPRYFTLTTQKIGEGIVPVTTTMRLEDQFNHFVEFDVPPITGGEYTLQYNCASPLICPSDAVVTYTLTVDYDNDFPFETNENNNSESEWIGDPYPITPLSCTPPPTRSPSTTATPNSALTGTPTNPTTFTPIPTDTPPTTASITPTTCAIEFTDVPPEHTFYTYIQCLACRGIINGYTTGCDTGDPCFRPGDNVTRGQIAKIVAQSAGFVEPATGQTFEDVPPASTFYEFVERLATRNIMSGYPCGGPGEPCWTGDLPYFRPGSSATRGQLAKIVSNAANLQDPVSGQSFEDVEEGSTFYSYIQRLYMHGVMSGYPCGGPGEPCGPGNLPYFRPNAHVTRGQTSKIVANTFYPDCPSQ